MGCRTVSPVRQLVGLLPPQSGWNPRSDRFECQSPNRDRCGSAPLHGRTVISAI
jgi:hypothetical protein